MFEKVEVSKIEQKLLLFTALTIPVLTFCLILAAILINIYDYIFPPLPNFSSDGWGTDPILAWFRIFTSICLGVSAILIVYKRIVFSTLINTLPLFAFTYWALTVHLRIQYLIENNSEFGDTRSLTENVYSTLNSVDIVFLSFITVLLFWQISILLRFFIKTFQKDCVLP